MSLYPHWLWFDLTRGNKAPFTQHFTRGFTVEQKFTFCFLRGPVISVCGPVCSHNPRCQTMSAQSPHPVVRIKEVTVSPCQTAVTAWRQPAKWTAPVKASRATPPASIARLPVSLNPRGPLMFFMLMLLPLKLLFWLWVLAASPPKTLTLDEVMESARDLSNLSIAHEITVNPDFRVEPSSLPEGRCVNAAYFCNLSHKLFFDYISTWAVQPNPLVVYSLWKAVKNAMHKAFWNILESELNDDPPVYGQAIRLLEEIREVTLHLKPLDPCSLYLRAITNSSYIISKMFFGADIIVVPESGGQSNENPDYGGVRHRANPSAGW